MRKGERTRHMIIQKATALFNQKGYVASSMVDVMNETGLERGGLYNHFSSKDELAIQVFDNAVETMITIFQEALSQDKNAISRLISVLRVFSGLCNNTPIPGGCPIMNVAIETDTVHPELKEKARQAMEALRQTVSRVIIKGQERGEVNADVQPDAMATILISSLEGALMLSRLYEDQMYMEQMITYLEDFIVTRMKKT